ncbi:hypothetical protein TNIN_165011 [Trichonephila inaurata madagascariensis]|uniref:Uncharacterized protein n=1 Tax=Trichonephila inaurata madagascariensis TaxID=2747483 RepID=A0A8X7CU51_9ARAC|nr:hypothetical protein TNIN_165011 [Trichonephila inaurata madagascariensis]
MRRRHPHHWKLDSYLQIKPLRHYSRLDKENFYQLKRIVGEEDWVRELLKNGSGEPRRSKLVMGPCATKDLRDTPIRFLPSRRMGPKTF